MTEERLICPTTPKLSTKTKYCLKTKLQIYTAPRNGTYTLLACVIFYNLTFLIYFKVLCRDFNVNGVESLICK